MKIILTLLMVISAVLAAVSAKMKIPLGAIGCSVLVIILAISRSFIGSGPAQIAVTYAERDQEAMAAVLAQKVAERHPGKRVGLLVPPEELRVESGAFQVNKRTQDLLAKALKRNDLSVEIILLPIDPNIKLQPTPTEEIITAEEAHLEWVNKIIMSFDADQLNSILQDQQGKVDVVLCTLYVHSPISAKTLLAKGKGPDLVLMHPDLKSPASTMQSTVLDAVLMNHPKASWEFDQKLPKDDTEVFNLHYVLATRDNPSPLP